MNRVDVTDVEYGDFTCRPTVLAPVAAVAAGHPLAAQTGLRVLQEGGNAVDAAIAAAGVLSVVLPDTCGLGGDVFALVYDPDQRQVSALNGSGRAPRQLGELVDTPPEHGPAAATVPGAVRAWQDLLDRFGTRPLGDLLTPAIQYADRGFPVGQRLALEVGRSSKGMSWAGSFVTTSACQPDSPVSAPYGLLQPLARYA